MGRGGGSGGSGFVLSLKKTATPVAASIKAKPTAMSGRSHGLATGTVAPDIRPEARATIAGSESSASGVAFGGGNSGGFEVPPELDRFGAEATSFTASSPSTFTQSLAAGRTGAGSGRAMASAI